MSGEGMGTSSWRQRGEEEVWAVEQSEGGQEGDKIWTIKKFNKFF